MRPGGKLATLFPMGRKLNHLVAVTLVLGLIIGANGVKAITENEREILEDFFVLTEGENWLRTDGWLNPEINPCDWYGVDCQYRYELDREVIRSLRLPANALGGTLDTRIFEVVHSELDLSDNQIGGALDRLPRSPGRVDLSNNQLTGPLPSEFSAQAGTVSGSWLPSSSWYLDLSGNDFEGEVPADWAGTLWLSLAGNRLEGMPESLFQFDMHPHSGRFLDLSDNQFSGVLPTDLNDAAFMPHNGPSRWGGGLNLCWNDFEVDNPDLMERIGALHVGGDSFVQCLGQTRAEMDAELSGSWYDPERSGEGVVFHQLADDQALIYWFTFDEAGNQRWLFGAGRRDELAADWPDLQQTRGQFGSGFADDEEAPMETRGGFRLDHLGDDSLLAERRYIDRTSNVCISIYPPPLSCFGNAQSDRRAYSRLTELAGTSCDNNNQFAELSGAWFNPELDGEGFLLEVLPDQRAAVYWFTYEPGDSDAQAWMLGSDTIGTVPDMPPFDSTADFSVELYRPKGARFGKDFDPADIELLAWGDLHMSFDGPDSGWVEWRSDFDDFGSGAYPIQRLTRPLMAECSDND